VPKLCPGCRRKLTAAAREDMRLDVLREHFERALGREVSNLFARGAGCENCLGKSSKIGIAGIKGRRLIGEILIPDQRICDLLRERRHDSARCAWLVDERGQSMAIVGFPYLLAGEIGVQEWVSYIGGAEDLKTDLALRSEAEARA
jgi:type II secretory ATPase GspE/PulE/Tfp pilus assembly ATPase PilB-like protein